MTIPPSLTTPPLSPSADGIAAPASDALAAYIAQRVVSSGGWLGFDAFMDLALYTPGWGYYANGSTKFGQLPQGSKDRAGQVVGQGSDFVTAPELSVLFGSTLARQVAQALTATHTDVVWEFGAGTGALALQLLQALGEQVREYVIVDVSDALKERQRLALGAFAHKVRWVVELPAQMQGVVVGNEVLDAMPVQLLARVGGVWHERGVALASASVAGATHGADTLVWQDRPTALRPPVDVPGEHDYLTEIHPQAEGFVRTLADRLVRGAVFLVDYGFSEAEYYHPQRHMGTVMCHRAHQSDPHPLLDVGLKDITAHVNFTGVAVAAQEAGFDILGYTSQAHFLINCGLVEAMQGAPLAQRVAAQRLILEHEMGEFFKVIGLAKGAEPWQAIGFARGDRTHRL